MPRGGARPGGGRRPAPTAQVRCYEEDVPRLEALKREKTGSRGTPVPETTAEVIRRAIEALEEKESPAE